MEYRTVGKAGHQVGGITLGCLNFGSRLDQDGSFRLMDHAFEKGITFFDTAEEYTSGEAERIIGNWFRSRGCRDQVTLCSKILQTVDDIHEGLSASLDRLGTGHVEIYLMHEYVASPPVDEVLAAFTEEVDAGRIKTIGCSNHTTAQLRYALKTSDSHGYHRYELLQPEYSLVMPPVGIDNMFPAGLWELEDQVLPLCQREGMAVTPYSPLGRGLLTGKYTREQPLIPGARFEQMNKGANTYLNNRNFQIVDKLRVKSQELGITMTRLALAWVMSNPAVTSTIIGPRTTEQIDDAIAAYELAMDPELRAEMSAWSRIDAP